MKTEDLSKKIEKPRTEGEIKDDAAAAAAGGVSYRDPYRDAILLTEQKLKEEEERRSRYIPDPITLVMQQREEGRKEQL